MTTLFISDLHLAADAPHRTELFFSFLKNHTQDIDALYILGDLFEVWIGDDCQTQFEQEVVAKIKALADKGVAIYFMRGNRDFMIDTMFAKQAGCTLLNDPCLIQVYGEPIVLAHGDSLCTQDKTHLLFRQVAQHLWVKAIYLKLPLGLRKHIAQQLRKKSKTRNRTLSELIMDADGLAISKLLTQFHTHTLIHGHTHKPTIEYFKLNGSMAQRIVLSDWEKQANLLVCSPNTEKRLIYF